MTSGILPMLGPWGAVVPRLARRARLRARWRPVGAGHQVLIAVACLRKGEIHAALGLERAIAVAAGKAHLAETSR